VAPCVTRFIESDVSRSPRSNHSTAAYPITAVVDAAIAADSSQPGGPPILLSSWKMVRPKNPSPKVTISSRARCQVISYL
jgi:hypothetical protein